MGRQPPPSPPRRVSSRQADKAKQAEAAAAEAAQKQAALELQLAAAAQQLAEENAAAAAAAAAAADAAAAAVAAAKQQKVADKAAKKAADKAAKEQAAAAAAQLAQQVQQQAAEAAAAAAAAAHEAHAVAPLRMALPAWREAAIAALRTWLAACRDERPAAEQRLALNVFLDLGRFVKPRAAGAASHLERADEERLEGEGLYDALELLAKAGLVAEEGAPANGGPAADPTKDANAAIRRALLAAIDGQKGAAMRHLEAGGMHQLTEPVAAAIAAQFPAGDEDAEADAHFPSAWMPLAPLPQAVITARCDQLLGILKDRRSRRGGGMSGWSYMTMDLLVNGTRAVAEDIVEMLRLLAAGKLLACRTQLSTQRGLPLVKGDVADVEVRAIGVPEVLMRLLSSTTTDVVTPDALARLHHDDLGYGAPAGVEVVIHATRAHRNTAHAALLELDCRNAFHTVAHDEVHASIEGLDPLFTGYIKFLYGAGSHIVFRDDKAKRRLVLHRATGLLMGDQASMLVYNLVLSRRLAPVRAAMEASRVLTIHDDIVVLTTVGAAAVDFADVEDAVKLTGGNLNRHKCYVHGTMAHAEGAELAAQLAINWAPHGVKLGGAPIGSDAYCLDFARKRAAEITAALRRIEGAYTSHVTLPLKAPRAKALFDVTRICAGPMGLHLLSTVPPHLVSEAAAAIDDAFLHTALVLLGHTKTPMPPAASPAYARIRDTMLSPIRPGGMGLPCHATTADAAYVASWMRVATRVIDIVPGAHDEALTLAVTRLKLVGKGKPAADGLPAAGTPTAFAAAPRIAKLQSKLTGICAAAQRARHRAATPLDSQARAAMLATEQEGSGDWLYTSAAFHWAHMVDAEFQAAGSFRAGLPIPAAPGGEPLKATSHCHAPYTKKDGSPTACSQPDGEHALATGEHAQGCVGIAGKRTHRHDLLRDAVIGGLRAHGNGRVSVEQEPYLLESGLHMAPGLTAKEQAKATKMRADVKVTNNQDGAEHFVDVTVGHPTGDDKEPLKAAKDRLAYKIKKYGKFVRAADGNTVPRDGHLGVVHLPYETYGGAHPYVFVWLENVGRIIHPGEVDGAGILSDPGGRRADFVRDMRMRMSVAVARGNARLLCYWRRRGAETGTREDAVGWWGA